MASRLPDRIAIGVLTQTFPPELVDRVLEQTSRGELAASASTLFQVALFGDAVTALSGS